MKHVDLPLWLKQLSGDEWMKNQGLSTAELMTGDGWQVCICQTCPLLPMILPSSITDPLLYYQ